MVTRLRRLLLLFRSKFEISEKRLHEKTCDPKYHHNVIQKLVVLLNSLRVYRQIACNLTWTLLPILISISKYASSGAIYGKLQNIYTTTLFFKTIYFYLRF